MPLSSNNPVCKPGNGESHASKMLAPEERMRASQLAGMLHVSERPGRECELGAHWR